MRLSRLSFTSFAASHRTRGIFATAAASIVLAASALSPASTSTADASNTNAPVGRPSAQFLTLPFAAGPNMNVLSGWYYSGSGGSHGGIDYVNGPVNNSRAWRTFPIIAAADGEACANCSSRQGNAVWIKHNINGQTYYTYYGHLSSIASYLPRGSQSNTVRVKRGQILGWAGDTGVAPGVLHLHFALYNANSTPVDPYSIGRLREYYPKPTNSAPGTGWFMGIK